MTTYTSDELISSTNISKKFGTYLKKVHTGELKKLGILKNNKIEAVMLPGELYELVGEQIEEYVENMQIMADIKGRLKTNKEDYISGEDVFRGLNLS